MTVDCLNRAPELEELAIPLLLLQELQEKTDCLRAVGALVESISVSVVVEAEAGAIAEEEEAAAAATLPAAEAAAVVVSAAVVVVVLLEMED